MTMPVIQPEVEPAICAGCGGRILDRYYLLAVDCPWHATCLQCAECKTPLDSETTCFAKDGNIYCKEDYYRMFAMKRCARCDQGISSSEMVMRARDNIYHIGCFSCVSCGQMLATGEQFGMKDSLIFCKSHYDQTLDGDFNIIHSNNNNSSSNNNNNNSNNNSVMPPPPHFLDNHGLPPHISPQGATPFYNGSGSAQKGRPRKKKNPLPDADLSHMPMCMGVDGDFSIGHDGIQMPNPRQKRMRTSFKHHQLRIMKSYFTLNHNPDAKDLKQLAQKTGLNKRVLQVWFQNARAKYRRNVLKQDGDKKSPDLDGSSQSTADGAISDMDQVSDSGAILNTKMEPTDMDSVDFSDSNSSHSQSYCDLQSMEQIDCGMPHGSVLGPSSMGLTELFKSEFYD